MRNELVKNAVRDEQRALKWLAGVPAAAVALGTLAVLVAIWLGGS